MCRVGGVFLLQKIMFDKSAVIKMFCRLFIISLFCFFSAAVLMFISAFVLSKINFSYEMLLPVTAVILAVSATFDGFVISRWYKENGLIWGILAGIILICIIVFYSVLYDTFCISAQLFIKAVVAITSGAIGGIIGVNTN